MARDAVLLTTALVMSGVAAAAADDPLPESWHVDRLLYPEAYGILANEKLMSPVDMSAWPVKIGPEHQLFVDDYLIAEMTGLVRDVHQARKHPANPLVVGDKPWEQRSEGRDPGVVFQIVRRDEATGRFRMCRAKATSSTPRRTASIGPANARNRCASA